ncbi:RnfABCDGE type electron transport complex subunit D [Candidatus Desantisbacteria bacterium]|nr:RnfABCDGE type electron transport complex subunit D [Candidatus Desantisbacteria bacterium]
MQSLKQKLDNLSGKIEKNEKLKKFKPISSALDKIFFGTSEITSVIPHVSDNIDLKRLMLFVIYALLPAVIASIYLWGLRVLVIIIISYLSGAIVEVSFAIIRKKEIHEGFFVTGLIFPLILPPTVPLWIVAAGVIFGVLFGKEVFGGTGRNIFNPAIAGRIFLSISFPEIMTVNWQIPKTSGLGGFVSYQNGIDAITKATPLVIFKNQKILTPITDLLFGSGAGCIGETFRIGLIAGGLFLIYTKIADWRIPLSYLSSVIIFSFLGNTFFPGNFVPPLFQLFSGGLLLGDFFMATDPVTSPFTKPGRWIGGILLGFLTVIIRGLSGYVEGVMFSILLVNAFTPLIDSIVLKIRYKA